MRVVMVTDDVRIDRRILAESESLAGCGHEVIIVAAWEEGLARHLWHGPVKIERFSHDRPGPVADDYGFPAGEPFWLAQPPLWREVLEVIARIRRSVGLMIRKSRVLVIVTTSIRRSFHRLGSGAVAVLSDFAGTVVNAATVLLRGPRDVQDRAVSPAGRPKESAGSSGAGRPKNVESIELPPAERALAGRLKYFDPDVIHAHDLPQLRVGVHVKRALGIPLIYDAHELYPEIGTLTPRDKAVLRAREQLLLPECDRVITVNSLLAEEMVGQYGIGPPLVIQNAVSAPSGFCATASHDRFREEFAIGKSDYILLYQGWLAMHRGLQVLVQAMPRIPDNVHLVFLGYGNAKSDLRDLSDRLGVNRRVHLKDAVTQEELLFWTASADIGLIPYSAGLDLNTRYCSPNKLYEYIGAGLPILGNEDLPFVRSFIASNDFGRVAALRTPDDLACAIISMVGEGRPGLDRFKQNILRRRAEFAWSVEEKKLLQAYDAVLRQPPHACQGAGRSVLADAGRS